MNKSLVRHDQVSALAITDLAIVSHDAERVELAALIAQTVTFNLYGRAYRIAVGRNLLRIHAIKAKPGYGSFMSTVRDEIGMP